MEAVNHYAFSNIHLCIIAANIKKKNFHIHNIAVV